MSIPSYRLNSQGRFQRPQNKNVRCVVFLSVEGNRTEKQYFTFVNNFHDTININRVVEVRVLERKNSDTNSTPQDVLNLLREYVELRNNQHFKGELQKIDELKKFEDKVLQTYVENEDSLPKKVKKEIRAVLIKRQLDLQYLHFLNTYKHENDIFGVVVDRDAGSHTCEQIEKLFAECDKRKWYCFLTNPCFEFWLLLHICNIREEYSAQLKLFLQNRKKSISGKKIKYTFVSEVLYKKTKIRKSIQERDFKEYFLYNIDNAIQNAQAFSSNRDELLEKLGTNIPELFKILRK